jgi:seryl-tRNA synthetase
VAKGSYNTKTDTTTVAKGSYNTKTDTTTVTKDSNNTTTKTITNTDNSTNTKTDTTTVTKDSNNTTTVTKDSNNTKTDTTTVTKDSNNTNTKTVTNTDDSNHSINISDVHVALANSTLSGTVTDNTVNMRGADLSDRASSNNISGSSFSNVTGISATSQNSGENSLIQQNFTIQSNVNAQ